MRNHIKRTILCMSIAIPALSGVALAAEEGQRGFQIGIDAGRAEARKACDNIVNCDSSDRTVRVDVGYQFTPNLGVELGYTSFGTVFDANNNTATAKQDANAWTASVVGTVPIGNRFGIYGRAGAARYNNDSSGTIQGLPISGDHDRTKPYYGGGVRIALTENFALRGEFQRYKDVSNVNGKRDDVDAWYGGVVFMF